jgi:adenylate cyclase
MPTEIEKKFLVKDETYKQLAVGIHYRQGYLNRDKERTVRIRVAGDEAFLTIKGITRGIERLEFEYPISLIEANEMIDLLCEKPIIEKYRYSFYSNGHEWEVDDFLGDNEGLVIAEIELDSTDELVDLPEWIGEEVTGDARYYNSTLSVAPYRLWTENIGMGL